ncbi:hypothetical protein AURDEDRAFT_169755 [Auricularia subglabra TFB-10046 SS5]|nr:hypothetical protein AURDEDRAFT_169755 [Auricularia subglabra TFB-10046 SS5]
MLPFSGPLLLLASLFANVNADGPREQCVGIWNVRSAGQTCETISRGVGVSIDWLLAHNPDLVCDGRELTIGTRVCTNTYTPTCAKWEVATEPSCDNLRALFNLTVDQFVVLNDNVDGSCQVVVGKEYCVTDNWCLANPEECCSFFPEEPICPKRA